MRRVAETDREDLWDTIAVATGCRRDRIGLTLGRGRVDPNDRAKDLIGVLTGVERIVCRARPTPM